jgi:hypothetical protein
LSLAFSCKSDKEFSGSVKKIQFVIPGFLRNVDDISALLVYYAASKVNPLPTFRESVSVSSSMVNKSKKKSDLLTIEDGTYTLSRNVGKLLPFEAA